MQTDFLVSPVPLLASNYNHYSVIVEMFRQETRFILIILFLVAWTIPIYMIVKYSIQNKTPQEVGLNLEAKIRLLQAKLSSLEHQQHHKRDILGSERSWRVAAAVPEETVSPMNNINIFLESRGHFEKGKQFYKSTANGQAYYYPGEANDAQKPERLFSYVKQLPESRRKRILVTGGAGFVGSHLVDSLMLDGHEVIVCDNFFTGRKSNVEHWQGHSNFELMNHDIINPLTIEVNEIYHLASPASPVHYMSNPIKTIKTNSIGTINMLGLAKRVGARILIASTSEIYGDPEQHPQSESYWGNTNPIGPRSCYDESKRLSESLAMAYNWRENVSVGIARIFNTYGPRMHPNDGRVVSNFLIQAINNQPLTIYGSGDQTRSFQYVSDLVSGLKKLMQSNITSPVNLGNPNELTIQSLALRVKQMVSNCSSEIIFSKLPIDDPNRRRPDIRKAEKLLDWRPITNLLEGLERTIEYFTQETKLAFYSS